MSASGGYTTVRDLLRFANTLRDNKLLDAHDTALLTTSTAVAPGRRYAFGFEDHLVTGMRCFGHSGEMLGENGNLEICPAAGYVVAVLANMDPPAGTRISTFVVNRVPELRPTTVGQTPRPRRVP
jgi:D-alanyl-D-alanine carboxypeptidase